MYSDNAIMEIIRKHNDRVRSYWHERPQTISCRVRNKKKNNSNQFRTNIILDLYYMNKDEYRIKEIEINKQDYQIIQDKCGFTEVNNALKRLEEQKKKAMVIKNYELLDHIDIEKRNWHKKQFALSQSMQDINIIATLELHNVVGVKIPGYYKELFFLKCNLYGINPAFKLRVLYHTISKLNLMDIPEIIDREFADYREEILFLLNEITEHHWYFKRLKNIKS